MRIRILVAATVAMTDIAHAGDIYIYDLLKGPAHAHTWKVARGSAKGVPAWLRDDENGHIADPAKTVSIEAKTYSISVLAKHHATNEQQPAMMLNAGASRAWAEVQEEGKRELCLGKPAAAQKSALDAALAE